MSFQFYIWLHLSSSFPASQVQTDRLESWWWRFPEAETGQGSPCCWDDWNISNPEIPTEDACMIPGKTLKTCKITSNSSNCFGDFNQENSCMSCCMWNKYAVAALLVELALAQSQEGHLDCTCSTQISANHLFISYMLNYGSKSSRTLETAQATWRFAMQWNPVVFLRFSQLSLPQSSSKNLSNFQTTSYYSSISAQTK